MAEENAAGKIEWRRVRPEEDRSERLFIDLMYEDEKKYGVDVIIRAEFNGVKLEVRFFSPNDYEGAAGYFRWTVRKDMLSAMGEYHIEDDFSKDELEAVRERAKRNAEKVAAHFANFKLE